VTDPAGATGLVPPFLVGAALAVVGGVAVGLLLYGGPGFIPALSVILAVIFLALAVGLWAGLRVGRKGGTEEARRRWLPLLVAVSLAAVFSGLWEVFRGFQAGAVSQGAGLALLAALPMYAGGRVLGGLVAGSGEGGGVAPSALAGVGVGILGVGTLLFPTFSPTVMLLLSLMVISAAARLHGRVLDRRAAVKTIRQVPVCSGDDSEQGQDAPRPSL
jgi:cytochrome bd-type quinol oxidase subunit 2